MRHRPGVAAACITALALVGAGCGRALSPTALPNQPPRVEFTEIEAAAGTMRAAWSGFDPDGRVDRYLVTEDLRAVANGFEGWIPVIENRREIPVRRPRSAACASAREGAPREPRVIAVRAVDDRGGISLAAARAWFDDNIAPTVRIVSPRPSALLVTSMPTRATIRWKGEDPDGPRDLPRSYRYKLILETDTEFPLALALADPDSLRRFYSPGFEGWTEVRGSETEATLEGLPPSTRCLFVITAIDKAGDYDPVFSLDKNMLHMRTLAGAPDWPTLTLRLDSHVILTWGGESGILRLELPAGSTLTTSWTTLPGVPEDGFSYRLALDEPLSGPWLPITEVSTLSFEENDSGGNTHRLGIELRDSRGARSTLIVEFAIVTPTFARDLLVVDDTRLVPDFIVSPTRPDSLRPPSGAWPTAAELDTFLYAVGGVRWRMTPAGTLSPRGILAGYPYDTLGTRTGLENPPLAVPLSMLSQYRHVVWIVDQHSASMTASPTSPVAPTTLLRWACSPGRSLPLAAYVEAGGSLWALGGGFGLATSAPWDLAGNNVGGVVFSSVGPFPDLRPGMFMYDLVHWRSEFVVAQSRADYARAPAPSPPSPFDYSRFPDALRLKTPATDPLFPFRSASSFYVHPLEVEYLRLPNVIGVDTHPSPRHERIVPTLDTLMSVRLFAGDTWYPVMTHYRGPDNGPVVFSGHNIWGFRRDDCQQLVDAVVGGIWGLQRTVGPVAAAGGAERRAGPRRRR
jgi:hypothetical protein